MACGSFFKWWIYASITLILIIGIVTEIIFIVLARGKFAEATESGTSLIVVGTIFLAIMLIIVIVGCCGVSKQSACLLIIYAVVAALLFVGFWIAFAYMKKGKDNIHDDIEAICNNEEKGNFINDLEKVYKENLEGIFCTNACPCKGDKLKFPLQYATAVMNRDTGSSIVSECANSPVADNKKTVLSFLGWLEEEKECSGICKAQKWYYFSDVNRGVPPKACKDPLLDFIDSRFFV